jgi:hypothetical protein
MSYDAINNLTGCGYSEREAAFLYIVAVHSGYFLRRQFNQFVARERGAIATHFLRRAAELGHVTEMPCAEKRIIYHLSGKQVYGMMGPRDSQSRRIKSPREILRRLMARHITMCKSASTIQLFSLYVETKTHAATPRMLARWQPAFKGAKESATTSAQRIVTPTMFVNAQNGIDPQGQRYLYEACAMRGVQAQYVLYLDENHALKKPVNRRDLLERAAEWFQTYGPG